jgi:hypothetical protein
MSEFEPGHIALMRKTVRDRLIECLNGGNQASNGILNWEQFLRSVNARMARSETAHNQSPVQDLRVGMQLKGCPSLTRCSK